MGWNFNPFYQSVDLNQRFVTTDIMHYYGKIYFCHHLISLNIYYRREVDQLDISDMCPPVHVSSPCYCLTKQLILIFKINIMIYYKFNKSFYHITFFRHLSLIVLLRITLPESGPNTFLCLENTISPKVSFTD